MEDEESKSYRKIFLFLALLTVWSGVLVSIGTLYSYFSAEYRTENSDKLGISIYALGIGLSLVIWIGLSICMWIIYKPIQLISGIFKKNQFSIYKTTTIILILSWLIFIFFYFLRDNFGTRSNTVSSTNDPENQVRDTVTIIDTVFIHDTVSLPKDSIQTDIQPPNAVNNPVLPPREYQYILVGTIETKGEHTRWNHSDFPQYFRDGTKYSEPKFRSLEKNESCLAYRGTSVDSANRLWPKSTPIQVLKYIPIVHESKLYTEVWIQISR